MLQQLETTEDSKSLLPIGTNGLLKLARVIYNGNIIVQPSATPLLLIVIQSLMNQARQEAFLWSYLEELLTPTWHCVGTGRRQVIDLSQKIRDEFGWPRRRIVMTSCTHTLPTPGCRCNNANAQLSSLLEQPYPAPPCYTIEKLCEHGSVKGPGWLVSATVCGLTQVQVGVPQPCTCLSEGAKKAKTMLTALKYHAQLTDPEKAPEYLSRQLGLIQKIHGDSPGVDELITQTGPMVLDQAHEVKNNLFARLYTITKTRVKTSIITQYITKFVKSNNYLQYLVKWFTERSVTFKILTALLPVIALIVVKWVLQHYLRKLLTLRLQRQVNTWAQEYSLRQNALLYKTFWNGPRIYGIDYSKPEEVQEYLISTVASPILEEGVKRVVNEVSDKLIGKKHGRKVANCVNMLWYLWEADMYVSMGAHPLVRLSGLFMHHCWAQLPYLWGVVAHAVHNNQCYIMEHNYKGLYEAYKLGKLAKSSTLSIRRQGKYYIALVATAAGVIKLTMTILEFMRADLDMQIVGELIPSTVLTDPDTIPEVEALKTGIYQLPSHYTATICLGKGDPMNIDPAHKLLTPEAECFCDSKPKYGGYQYGNVFDNCFVCSSCNKNQNNALCNRHLAKRHPNPKPLLDDWTNLLLDKVEQNARAQLIEVNLTYEEWLVRWTMPRRVAIDDSLEQDQFGFDMVEGFIKRECNIGRPKKSRLIQKKRFLAGQAFVSPSIASLQKAICKALYFLDFEGITITLASGMNNRQIGQWLDDAILLGARWWYERDGKNWDSSMGPTHHALKMNLYRRMLPQEVATAIDKGYKVRGKTIANPNVIRYEATGTTKSGHADTTLGNSVINAILAAKAMKDCGYKGHILVAGDDLVVGMEHDFSAKQLSWSEANYGIVPEYCKFEDPLDISFISGQFYPHPDGTHTFGPKPAKILAKLFWSHKFVPKKGEVDYTTTVVQGMMQAFSDDPIVTPFLLLHDTSGKVQDERKYGKYFQTLNRIDVGGEQEWINYYYRKYQITWQEIADYQALISKNPVKSLICHEVYNKLKRVDLAEVFDRPLVLS